MIGHCATWSIISNCTAHNDVLKICEDALIENTPADPERVLLLISAIMKVHENFPLKVPQPNTYLIEKYGEQLFQMKVQVNNFNSFAIHEISKKFQKKFKYPKK